MTLITTQHMPFPLKELREMKNWKTTAIGIAGGALTLMAGGMDWKNAIVAVTLGALGSVSKDHDVTGGTKQQ